MSTLTIEPATANDCSIILGFIRDLAEYEKALHEVETSEQDLANALFAENPKAFAVICRMGDTPIGFALYFYNYSTWTGKFGLFLEDLYVSVDHRGTGAGKALLKYLAQLAVKNDCARFEWNVIDWNEPAIQFYQSFGAKPQSQWIGYRLAGSELKAFADS